MKTSTLRDLLESSDQTAALQEMRRRIAVLRAAIEDEDGAGELPMIVFYVVNGDEG